MLSILVACSKGGCGKTTISTHLAAYFALAGKHTALVDADPQHSSTRWCEKRAPLEHAVLPIDGCRRQWRRQVPSNTQRMIVDAAAGANGRDLEPIIEHVDAILVPVLPSTIDLEATLPFLQSLTQVERVRRGRCRVGLVANRTKPWTQATQTAATQLQTWPYPLVASLRDSQAYVLLAGLGKSLFDYHSEQIRSHQQDWSGIFQWLRDINRGK